MTSQNESATGAKIDSNESGTVAEIDSKSAASEPAVEDACTRPECAVSKVQEDEKALAADMKRDLGQLAHDAKEALKQGAAAGIAESREELRIDKEEAHELKEKDEATLKEVAHDIAHPKEGIEALKAPLERSVGKAAHRLQELEHPKELVHEIHEHIEDYADEAAEVRAQITSNMCGPVDKKKLPRSMKVFGILCIVGFVLTAPAIVETIFDAINLFRAGGIADEGMTAIVITFIALGDVVLMALGFLLLGIRLLRNERRFAALTIDGLFILMVLGILCSILTKGISLRLIFFGIVLVLLVALQSYIDPSLAEERELRRRLRDMELRDEAESGKLGLDQSGKGYITLNFYNLFWIFVVCSILGLIIETVFHMVYVDPGHYQDRAGLLFGPFSPIYGCGAVLMTIFLNRFHKSNVIIIFFVAAIIGGAFEYFTSVFMQYAFGAVAWDYTGMWLSIGGRTCGVFMAMWGLLGVVWIKLLLPLLLRIVNLIPWNWRYAVTSVCAALMLADAIMTLQALDCWYMRLSGMPIATPVEQFYDVHFDNTFMADRFQSMTIHPSDTVRGGN